MDFKLFLERKESMTQEEAVDKFLPIIEKRGSEYTKVSKVLAKPAKVGEKIVTKTSDGIETKNKAKSGDFIVKNATNAQEKYILSAKKMKDRYKKIKTDGEWDLYQATGKILAIPFKAKEFNMPHSASFEAEWGEQMKLVDGDMICTTLPDKKEVYRIAKKEFDETYKKS